MTQRSFAIAIAIAAAACSNSTSPGERSAALASRLAALVAGGIPPGFAGRTISDDERDQLTELYRSDPKEVLVLAGAKFTTDDYKALATFPGKVMIFNGLDTLGAEDAVELAQWKGKTLFLDIHALAPGAARGLSVWRGDSLHLDSLERIDGELGGELAICHVKLLGLRRASIDARASERLATFKGTVETSPVHTAADAMMRPHPESPDDSVRFTPLSEAIAGGDVESVRQFLQGGGAVDLSDSGTTLLMTAAAARQIAIAKLLIAAHANARAVDQRGFTSLYYALDDFREPPGDNTSNVSALVHLLVDAGADLSATAGSGVMWKPPLEQAAKRGDAELVRYLMAKGAKADPNVMIAAIDAGNADTVKVLIAAGVDIHPKSPELGMSPIHQAIAEGANEIRLARESGRDAEPMLVKRLAVVSALIDGGVDLGALNHSGETPLESAIDGGVIEIVKRLLDAKPALDQLDGAGHTPLQYLAADTRLEEAALIPIAELLRSRGARPDAKAASIATQKSRRELAKVLGS